LEETKPSFDGALKQAHDPQGPQQGQLEKAGQVVTRERPAEGITAIKSVVRERDEVSLERQLRRGAIQTVNL